jgi:5-methylcytosine-specific restriction endonuclease McrA
VLIKPSKESIRAFKKQMKLEWKLGLGWSHKRLIEYLNPKIKGWASYFKSVASKKTFSKLDDWMWKRQAWYCRRKHPERSWSWYRRKYWGKIRGRRDKWVFMDKTNGEEVYLWKLSWTPIQRHVLVKGRNSPDDPLLAGYWSRRQAQKGRFLFKKRSILWRRQAGLCKVCLEPIDNGEEVEEHHVLPRKLGGKDSIDNLLLLHGACHKQVHSKYNQQGDLITDGKQAA